jgi:hypothetical protein
MSAEERMKILTMLEENKLTADQAALLLNAMEEHGRKEPDPAAVPEVPPVQAVSEAPAPPAVKRNMNWFRVQVTDTATGKAKVHVRLPLSLVGLGLRMGARYTDEFAGIDMQELMEALRSGAEGKLIEVVDEEDGEHVEIFVE